MPNWCKGVLKVRGTKNNLLRLLNEGIERVGWPREENDDYTKYPLNVETDEYGDIFVNETDDEHHSWLYFKNSRRLFVDGCIEHYFSDWCGHDKQIMILDIKQAWRLERDYFITLSKMYNVDFRMIGYEKGGEFAQEIEVINGVATIYEEIEFEDYKWEAYDPRLGG